MKNIPVILAVLATATLLYSTEARVESMGSTQDFIQDDISVFDNPATSFDYGNRLVGALGRMEENNGSWERKDEWFGGWAIYPLRENIKLSLGATLNRPFNVTKQFQEMEKANFFNVNNGDNRFERPGGGDYPRYVDFLEAIDVKEPLGNVYVFAGASLSDYLSVAIGGRYAGYEKNSGPDLSSNSVTGGNLGVVYKFDKHSLEANINLDKFSLVKKHDYLYHQDSLHNPIDVSFDETNVNVGLRMFYALSSKNVIVPLVLLDKSELLGINKTEFGIGIGFNRNLYKGLIWSGMKYIYHTATYPERIANQLIYPNGNATALPAGIKEQSHKLVFSFGVEKKMLWDWFTLRVGGNKVFEYLTKKKGDIDYEKSLEERDVDAVAWGIALGTPDDRLMFDITVSEAFPYSNFLAGGEDGVMLYRIAAALKF